MSIPKKTMRQIELLAHDRISEIVRHYVGKKGLRQRRNNEYEFVGRCPFHAENTPSFTVTTAKGFYHCFGCGAHGNAIEFIMEAKECTYIEAVLEVARLLGVRVPSGQTNASRARRRYRGKKRREVPEKQKAISERTVLLPLQEKWQHFCVDDVDTGPVDSDIPF